MIHAPRQTGFPCLLIAAALSFPAAAVASSPSNARGALLGPCCIGVNCVDNITARQCFDVGGVWLGEGTDCATALAAGYCVQLPACPLGAMSENEPGCGQPQPDNFNAGPLSPSCAFTFLMSDGCNANWCATSSADDRNMSNRDLDWFFLLPGETTEYTACVTAEFFPEVQFWQLGDVDPCANPGMRASVWGDPGDAVCVTQCLLKAHSYAIQVAAVDAAGNPRREGVGCSDYRLTTNCGDCVGGSCCLPDNSCDDGTFAGGTYAGEIVTQINCVALGGVYNGDGTQCSNVDCGGGCCRIDGSCVFSSQSNCLAVGGSYGGEGSACAELTPCPICIFEDPGDRDNLLGQLESCSSLGTDIVNGGCSAGAVQPLFSPITCGQTICATTTFDGNGRDADWYHLTLPPGPEAELLITLENQLTAGNLFARLRYYPNQQTPPAGTGDGSPCSLAGTFDVIAPQSLNQIEPGVSVFPIVVPAGRRYSILVTYDNNTPGLPLVPCLSGSTPNYRLRVECASTPCEFACAAAAVQLENETACALATSPSGIPIDGVNTNTGCSAVPMGSFTPASLGQSICGSVALRQSRVGGVPTGALSVVRDFDWYRLNGLSASSNYSLEFRAEFNAMIVLQPLSGPGGCLDPAVFTVQIAQCVDRRGADAVLIPSISSGDYAVMVAPDLGAYAWMLNPAAEEHCPSRYEFRFGVIDPGCAGQSCGDSNCDGTVTVGDIGFFVRAVAAGQSGWDALFPGGMAPCDFICANDTNGDGSVTVGDIGRFVQRVASGVPCP